MKTCSKLLLPLLLLGLPASCGQEAAAREARQKAQEAMEAIGNYTAEEWGKLSEKMGAGWDSLGDKLNTLREKTKTLGAEAQAKWNQKLQALQVQTAAAKQKLAQAAAAGSGASKEAVAALQKSYEAAKQAVEAAWDELNK